MRPALAKILGVLSCSLALAATSCGNAFDSQASIQSLRVLGVKVKAHDAPGATESFAYATPGDKVSLEMLYYDGSPRAFDADGNRKRDVEVLWLGGCHDPVGDLYYGCYPVLAKQFAEIFGQSSGGESAALLDALACKDDTATSEGRGALIATGSRYDCLKIPRDIISRRPSNEIEDLLDQGNTPYGLTYVFFAVCGGRIGAPPAGSDAGLPLACYDKETGEQLGADDFVFGYTPLYSYGPPPTDAITPDPSMGNAALAAHASEIKPFVNTNPRFVIDAASSQPKITFEGKVYDTPCSQGCNEGSACGQSGMCIPVVPHCTERKVADCPDYKLKPEVDRGSVETDEVAPPYKGRIPDEVIWLSYYAADGTIIKETTLVNDANKGWQDDYETKWSAPNAEAGETRIWMVAHDSRGGTAWTWQDVIVKLLPQGSRHFT